MINIGLLIELKEEIENEIKKVADLGFNSCQISAWGSDDMLSDEMAERIKKATKEYGVNISTFWAGWNNDAPIVWDFYSGPITLGLVPEEYRAGRLKRLMKCSDFAKKLGVENIATHVGFIPETPNTREYQSLICSLKMLAQYVKKNGQYFLFETGQETPVTLRRAIEDVGTGNLGINLDPANLILYGKANPVDALDVFGEFVRDIHGKDGCYPTNGKYLGAETPLGKGKVNYPVFIKRLKEIGYDGPITIEREISGEEQIRDIKEAKIYLEKLIAEA